jgi:hypothetical protein
MPTLSAITNNFFLNLINRLGVRPPPPESFVLSNVVQPVSIVDTDVTLSAVATSQLIDTPFTTGIQAAPGANTILADTGVQAAGIYSLYCTLFAQDGVNLANLQIQRRDAANAVTVWAIVAPVSASAGVNGLIQYAFQLRIVLLLNERVRILNTNVGGAGSSYQANIWLALSS